MNVGDIVFVVKWNSFKEFYSFKTGEKTYLFPWKTKIPDYGGIDHHWERIYEPNLTLKGTVNKREPTKLKSKFPIYEQYRYEVLEIIKHPKAGEFVYNEEERARWNFYQKYTEENILLLASTHTDKAWMKCYVQIEESNVSFMTPEQFADKEYNALREYHKGKYSIEDFARGENKNFPKQFIQTVYDLDDRVLFGSSYTKGKVQYKYIDKFFSSSGNPFIIETCVSYDGIGNADLPIEAIRIKFSELPKMFPDNTYG